MLLRSDIYIYMYTYVVPLLFCCAADECLAKNLRHDPIVISSNEGQAVDHVVGHLAPQPWSSNGCSSFQVTPSLASLAKDTAMGSGRAALGEDALPFSISLARLASQLGICVASYLARSVYATALVTFRFDSGIPLMGVSVHRLHGLQSVRASIATMLVL